MKTLLLTLLLVPIMSFGQMYTEGFPNGYIEPGIAFSWYDRGDTITIEQIEGEENEAYDGTMWRDTEYSISPIGYNSSGHLAIRVTFAACDMVCSFDDYILIQEFSGDVNYRDRHFNPIIIDKLILYSDISEGEGPEDFWKNNKLIIDSFLKKHNITESFNQKDNRTWRER